MDSIRDGVYVAALVIWVGAVLFLSFVVAPTLFQTLPPEEAGRAMSSMFPTYYLIGNICGGLLLLAGWLRRRAGDRSPAGKRLLWVVSLMLACNVYAGAVLQPRAAELKSSMRNGDSGGEARAAFAAVHRQAMALNAAVMLGGCAAVALASLQLRRAEN